MVPGATHTYEWIVDEISGPAEGDPDCIGWPYHTHISTPRGTNTGLVGASIVCRPGKFSLRFIIEFQWLFWIPRL